MHMRKNIAIVSVIDIAIYTGADPGYFKGGSESGVSLEGRS